VETARATILSEVSAVFGAYGNAVNQRHLSLIADFRKEGVELTWVVKAM
jgi:hypothetical protein